MFLRSPKSQRSDTRIDNNSRWTRTVSGDGAQPRNKRNLEATVTHDTRKTRVLYVCLFKLVAARAAAVLERAA